MLISCIYSYGVCRRKFNSHDAEITTSLCHYCRYNRMGDIQYFSVITSNENVQKSQSFQYSLVLHGWSISAVAHVWSASAITGVNHIICCRYYRQRICMAIPRKHPIGSIIILNYKTDDLVKLREYHLVITGRLSW
jgi:hypothetical protein